MSEPGFYTIWLILLLRQDTAASWKSFTCIKSRFRLMQLGILRSDSYRLRSGLYFFIIWLRVNVIGDTNKGVNLPMSNYRVFLLFFNMIIIYSFESPKRFSVSVWIGVIFVFTFFIEITCSFCSNISCSSTGTLVGFFPLPWQYYFFPLTSLCLWLWA